MEKTFKLDLEERKSWYVVCGEVVLASDSDISTPLLLKCSTDFLILFPNKTQKPMRPWLTFSLFISRLLLLPSFFAPHVPSPWLYFLSLNVRTPSSFRAFSHAVNALRLKHSSSNWDSSCRCQLEPYLWRESQTRLILPLTFPSYLYSVINCFL